VRVLLIVGEAPAAAQFLRISAENHFNKIV
jgi:hypothetical protein